jgi:hypothetical protein
MALALTASIVDKQNILLPLAVGNDGAVVRIAALQTDYIATLTVTGAVDKVTWTPFMFKSWLSLEVDPTLPNVAKVKFTGPAAINGVVQCYIQADDGSTKVKFPLSIEVVEPLGISVSGGTGIDPVTGEGRYDNLAAYDSTIQPLVLTAKGLHNLDITDGSVQFIAPSDLPQGLLFSVSNGAVASLSVAQPSTKSTSGGILPTRTSTYDVLAYRPGSMYDSIDHPFKRSISIGTLSEKPGSLNNSFACVYDNVNKYFKLNVLSDFIGGIGSSVDYVWTVTGTGTVANGGGLTDDYMNWTPTAAGAVTFTLTVKDSATQSILQTRSLGPLQANLGTTWDTGNAIKLQADAAYKSGAIGEDIPFTVSIPVADFAGAESISVSVVVDPVSDEVALPTPFVFNLTAASPTHTLTLTVPTSSYKAKWNLTATASDGATRQGVAQMVLTSTGLPTFSINNNNLISIRQSTGAQITPVALVSTRHSDMVILTDVNYSLVGAPSGLTIQNNKIVGAVPSVGTFSFRVMATRLGYAPSFTQVSLNVVASETPMSILSFMSTATQIQDDTNFDLSWGLTGTPKFLKLQQTGPVTNGDPVDVLGGVSATRQIKGTTVFGLRGADYRGTVYAKPIIVTSNSNAGATKLPSAPTIATIDHTNYLTINWSPSAINESYLSYAYWKVGVRKLDPAIVNLDPQTGLDLNTTLLIDPASENLPKTGPTGLVAAGSSNDSRIYSQQLDYSDYWIGMQAMSSNRDAIADSDVWQSPEFRQFPGKPDTSTVILDKTTVKMKESLTVQLSSIYGAADYWRVNFSDGTSTGWLPTSVKAQSKTFSIPGPQTATVEFERDYSTLTPKVKLRRSITLPIYVQNEVYNSADVNIVGIGNVGLGGEAGFEIADQSKLSFKREPYTVIVKALVKDDVTQELKLMVATSRSNNASSVLNTMAADVFPLVGRPHLKDLIVPIPNLMGDLALVTPVEITTTALPDTFVGRPMPEVQLIAVGGTQPLDWYSDSLPFGLKLNVDGTISGTPLQMGVYNINVAVKDSTNPPYIGETSVTMTIKSDLAVSPVTPKDATVGTYYSHQLVATGGLAPHTWALQSGSLPTGLSLDSATGKIIGYPVSYNSDEDFDTPFAFVAEVVDSVGAIASTEFAMNLLPMELTLGVLDQTMITQGEDFKLAIPVFGGRSPYSVTSFSALDNAIGSSLSIISPDTVDAVSGQGTANLTIVTGDQVFTPSSYPYQAVFPLTAAGGTAPYRWSLNVSDPLLNTVANPAVSASQAAGRFTADGGNSIHVTVTDANGTSVSRLITMTSTLNAGSGGTGNYSLEYVTINKNSSTDVANWTFTKINALPDAKQGTGYRPDATSFYGVALWNPVANRVYDLRTEATQVQMRYLYSRVGGTGQGTSSPLKIQAVSIQQTTLPSNSTATSGSSTVTSTGNPAFGTNITADPNGVTYGSGTTAWWGSGSTAITQALFNSYGALAADGTPYPDTWQAIDNEQLYISLANLGIPASGVWSWSIGANTTLPNGWKPTFVSPDGTEGATVTTNQGGYVRLKPTTISAGNFQPIATAQANPYILEVIATDSNNNAYAVLFNYYLISGGSVRARQVGNWLAGTAVIWPDGTTIGYTSPFSKTSLGDVLLSGPQSTITLANNTSGTVAQTGSTTPYFPMGVSYFQGDYLGRSSTQMTAGDQTAFAPVKGATTTAIGANPYTFVVLNDTGTAVPNAQIGTVGGFTLGTVSTDSNLSKEMSVYCSVPGGGITPVITVTSVAGDAMPNPWLSRFDAAGNFLGNPQSYADWYYILHTTGGLGPYTYRIESGTTLPGVSVHNAQNTEDFGIGLVANSPVGTGYSGDFLLISYTPDWTAPNLVKAGQDFVVNLTAIDGNGMVSSPAVIPFKVLPVPTGGSGTTSDLQVLSKTLAGGNFYIDGAPVEAAGQAITLNAPAVWTLSGDLPAGMFLSPQGQPSVKMHGPTISGGATASRLNAASVVLVGTPTGTPTDVTVTLTASAVGYAAYTQTLTFHTLNRVATITVLNGGNAIPGTHYSYGTGSPFVKLHCEGFDSGTGRPGLSCNFGGLGASYPTNVVTTYPGAQSFDLMFDFFSASAGSGTLTLLNAGTLTGSAQFTVRPDTLTATGTSVSQNVSEYLLDPFTVSLPPVVVTGGIAPYKIDALSVSDTTHFYIQNNQFFMNMATVTGGNTYTTNVTYRITDAANVSVIATTPSTVQVQVIAENYITANFINTSITATNGLSTTLLVTRCIKAQLGHLPFRYFVDDVTFSDPGMSAWVTMSPSNRFMVINRTGSTIGYGDYTDANVLNRLYGGRVNFIQYKQIDLTIYDINGNLINELPLGDLFDALPAGAIVSGTYAVQLDLRLVDAKGLSTTGTATVTIYVP